MAKKAKQKMRSNGHSEHCICQACVVLIAKESDEIQVYGQYKTFRDLVDALGDQHKPEKMYVYPTFAVFDFRWSIDSKKLADYLESRSATRYTGIHFDQNSYLLVIIDVAEKEKVDDDKSV